MDSDTEKRPAKRFKYESHKKTLKTVHLPSALEQTKFDHDLADNESHFHEALLHWQELNLAPTFLKFARDVDPLSASMPLLLHNWKEIVELWLGALDNSDDEGLKAILDLSQKLAHDLRTTLAPEYPRIIKRLLRLLPRTLSAEALTALLATFSAVFKYVLVPAVDAELLQQAWSAFADVLPQCHPEVQRATAEVWGATLRRLKASLRDDAVRLVASSSNSLLGDTCAWTLVTACKSVSQTLHTVTASLIAPLLRYYLSSGLSDDTFTLLRRLLTALIHHCKGPEQFAPVSDVLVNQFNRIAEDANMEETRRIIEAVTVVCSVRQGSRISQKHLGSLLARFCAVPLADELHSSLLKFSTSTLLAGDMTVWTAHGRNVLERAWQRPLLGMELIGALSDLHWGGWKLLALPHLCSNTLKGLEDHPARMLELLAALHRERRLADVDIVWKQRFQTWIDRWLSSWQHTEQNVQMLEHVIELADFVPSLASSLVAIVDQELRKEDPRSEYEETFANSAWVIGRCAQHIATRSATEWGSMLDLPKWLSLVAEKWGWCGKALEGLAALACSSRPGSHKIAMDVVHRPLRNALLSHSHVLRLNALRLLTSGIVDVPDGTGEFLKRVQQAEEISIDVQGVRERVLRIGRLPQVVKDGDAVAADVCARWLLAQLKVNLRPIWSHAAAALSALATRFEDPVWELVYHELQQASSFVSGTGSAPLWAKVETLNDDVHEEERSWRDPSAHKLRLTVAMWLEHASAKQNIVMSQISGDRFDDATYETQLLIVLEECSSLAEKHNRDLIPHFLSFAGPEASSRIPRYKLSTWLKLFAKMSNPNAFRSTATMRALYISLLSHPDRGLQRLSLSCLLTYKSPCLLSHEGSLRMLLDETKWRDELTQLNLAEMEVGERPELVDVIIRLLFGTMLERKGRSRGADRRAAVLSTLAGCSDEELPLLVDLMLQPVRKQRSLESHDGPFAIRPVPVDVSEKQQIGFLTLLGDVLKHLGSRLVSRWPLLLETLVDIVGGAQAALDVQKATWSTVEEEVEESDELDDADGVDESQGSHRAMKNIRQLGLKRFAEFFRCPVTYDFAPYMAEAFRAFISPRLPSLDQESVQAPSTLLDLCLAWVQRAEYARYLVQYDDRILPKVYDCLIATNVKPAVISKVFDIVEQLQILSVAAATILESVFKPHVSRLLSNLSLLVSRSKGNVSAVVDVLGRRQIAILSDLAPYLSDSSQAIVLLELFSPLLRRPHKIVPEKVKIDMVNIISNLLPLIEDLADVETPSFGKAYGLLAQLFQTLRSWQARVALVNAFRRLAALQPTLEHLAALMDSLNAYSTKRLEDPDFDRRLAAFAELNDSMYKTLSCRDWLPIIYNMLSFLQDPLELTIRSSAATSLKRFVDFAADERGDYEETFLKVLFPGLKNGLRSRTELVRSEILGVVSYAVSRCSEIASLQEMRVLLAGGDEEANFFNNIHHVQIHRRSRALRRLADFAEGHLRSNTLADVLIPLVGNYIVSTDTLDHHLVNEAVLAMGQLSKHLNWGPYHALVQRYLKLAKQKDASERVYVRTVVAVLDGFHFPMEENAMVDEPVTVEHEDSPEDSEDEVEPRPVQAPHDASKCARIQDAVNNRLLPSLIKYLEKRDETEDTLRIPIAFGIVQVARHLPTEHRDAQISKLMTVLSQVLRSKSQETRDLVRETLARIACALGPTYLPLMIREMRAALLRGPHLHVLAYSVHALLVHVTTGDHASAFSKLDECVHDVATVSSEVIFGESGKDVQAEGFKTKMREVRGSSSKGVDSFALMAKHVTPPKISSLLLPIRTILQETETLRVMQQAEELLRRIAGGLNSNPHLVPTEFLVLCHTLITQNARFLKDVPDTRTVGKGKRGSFKDAALVPVKRPTTSHRDHYANNSFRFVAFGLDLFNTAYRRGLFDFKDPGVMSRLESMVSVIGNTLYSSHMQVVIPGLKAASLIVKCPLQSISKSLPVFIRQIIDIIEQSGSTESDSTQTAFKSLGAILRDHPGAQVKEKDLVYILELLSPDLEEPSRQAAVFTMLRAIVSRRFVIPEIYDIMEKVAEIMVTNQSPQVQELCRGVLLQFLLDYPQGKGRLKSQMTFLVKNLSYVYESGRKSVMELLGAIIYKFDSRLVQEYSDLVFVGLVMVIANDDSAKCRELAAELIKSLLDRIDTKQRNIIMSHVHTWATQHSQPELTRVSAQLYGLLADFLKSDVSAYVTSILEDMNDALRRSALALESAATGVDSDADEGIARHWQSPYHTLLVVSKLLRAQPDLLRETEKIDWPSIVTLLLHPHIWVRTASCRLLGTMFASLPVAAPHSQDSSFSKAGMEEIATKLTLQLKSENLDEALGLQVVKNLLYIGKCFYAVSVDNAPSEIEDGADAEDDTNDVDENEEAESEGRHPLSWLFTRLSYQIRSALTHRRSKASALTNWSQQPVSVLRWFGAMVSYMEADTVEKYLPHVLNPVYRIVEDETIHDSQMEELKALAVELQDLIQTKVGTTKFSSVYSTIRQRILGIRLGRKTARAVQATVDPATTANRRIQRNASKKESRKRKTETPMCGRQKYRRT